MILIEQNRLYWNGVSICFASHSLPNVVDGVCSVLYCHSLGRTLVNVDGKYWMGDRDGALPEPDIIIGQVVGSCGLLNDPETMTRVIELIQVREDDGLQTKIKVM